MKGIMHAKGVIFLLLLTGCSGMTSNSGNAPDFTIAGKEITGSNELNIHQEEGEVSQVVLSEIIYSADFIPALDFLKQKGEKPNEQDLEGLKNESVLLFEFNSLEEIQEIYDSKRITKPRSEAMQYLVGEIAADLHVEQNGDEIYPNGVQFDGSLSGVKKMRVFFFFSGLDLKSEIKIKYYDELFGGGLINLTHKETK